jgi:hypothetical protein
MTLPELKWHIKRLEKDPKERRGINYQVANLEGKPLERMNNEGTVDSKIMCVDTDLYHGTVHKNNDQKVEEKYFGELYELFQNPEAIYENTKPKSPLKGREFHFVKKMKGGKALKVVLRHLLDTALQIVTMGIVDDHYKSLLYKKIW